MENKTQAVKVNMETALFQEKVRHLAKEAKAFSKEALQKTAHIFAQTAAQYTPPAIKKRQIPEKYYTRPILLLWKLKKGEYRCFRFTPQDEAALKKGMVYVVYNTRQRKKEVLLYTKNKTEAQRAASIKMRGLGRIMWGNQLDKLGGGAKIPASIKKLIRKSPYTANKPYGRQYIGGTEENPELIFINNAKIKKVAYIAINQGFRRIKTAIVNYIKKKLQGETKK